MDLGIDNFWRDYSTLKEKISDVLGQIIILTVWNIRYRESIYSPTNTNNVMDSKTFSV